MMRSDFEITLAGRVLRQEGVVLAAPPYLIKQIDHVERDHGSCRLPVRQKRGVTRRIPDALRKRARRAGFHANTSQDGASVPQRSSL